MMELAWEEIGGAGSPERRWAELCQQEPEAGGRALTLNLVCRAQDAADGARAASCLWQVGMRHPARVFVVTPTEAGTPRIRVAAHPRGSEMVELSMAPARAASWVAPRLAGDLPVVLLWRGGDPKASPEFEQWAGMADKVVIDAHRMRMGAEGIGALAERLRPGVHLSDLTWARLTPWRQLLCQGLETEWDGFRRIARVSITAGHGQTGTESLAATLFAGWMAQQLQWFPEARMGSQALRLQAGAGSTVTLRFQPCPSEERHGLLRRLVVEGEENGMSVVIQHRGQHLSMNVHRGGRLLGEWAGPARAEPRGEQEALNEELSIHGEDGLFQPSLRRGLELLARLEGRAA